MDSLSFSNKAWEQYLEWLTVDRKIFNRINILIRDIQRNGLMEGIGKPEVLRNLKAYSRRIDETHRLIYITDEKQNLRIISCKGHYAA
ncbi:MAG: Txe/YoeB family addiction module toxin [Synergistaceae bacterium]|jgi:toxin YoeB|nr:Txe/YoeB family addiction module toxin [Synergistaceae bacterium]